MPFDIHPASPTTGQRTLSVSFTKSDGTPGTVEGVPVWEVSDLTLATLVPAADGMSTAIQHTGAVGDVIVTMNADGDLGAGVFPIVKSDTGSMLAPLGATAAAIAVGDEGPIT